MPSFDPTILQLAVVSVLLDGEMSGREIRSELTQRKRNINDTAFYRLAGRMEKAGLLTARTKIRVVEGQTYKEKYYSLTGEGRGAYREAELLLALQGGAIPASGGNLP